jgi:2-polyprenyl-6-hydroxyphenyl methylase / 3-demethylubiquinone-9 3-methyltransferase
MVEMKTKNSTVDAAEVEQFSRIADEWWQPHGKFKPLHDMGPVRIGWIKAQIERHFPLEGLHLLDIGCGGGLMCEPFARLGASVTGIDASEKNIGVAKAHAEQFGLLIDYRATTAEALAESGTPYDVVLALEIVEHVADVELFVVSCAKLVKPGGLLIMSTLNRTMKSYAFAIIGAEYVMRLLPRGTHHWNKFLKPSELCRSITRNNLSVDAMTGMIMHPLSWKWQLSSSDLDVNYVVAAKKPL